MTLKLAHNSIWRVETRFIVSVFTALSKFDLLFFWKALVNDDWQILRWVKRIALEIWPCILIQFYKEVWSVI